MTFALPSSVSVIGRQNGQFNGQLSSSSLRTRHVRTDTLTGQSATISSLDVGDFDSLDFTQSINIGVDNDSAVTSASSTNIAVGAGTGAGYTLTITPNSGALATWIDFQGIEETLATNNTYQVVYTAGGAPAQANVVRDPAGDAEIVASGSVPLTVSAGIRFTVTSGPAGALSGETIDVVMTADATNAVAVGSKAVTLGNDSIAIGYGAIADTNSIAIGTNAHMRGNNSLFFRVGTTGSEEVEADLDADNTFVIGSFTGDATNNTGSVLVGHCPTNFGNKSVHVGAVLGASDSDESVSVGYGATTGSSGTYGIAIGYSATIGANYAIAIGHSANVAHAGSIAIGPSATSSATNELTIRLQNANSLQTQLTTDVTAGVVTTYLIASVNGTSYKIPLHALA